MSKRYFIGRLMLAGLLIAVGVLSIFAAEGDATCFLFCVMASVAALKAEKPEEYCFGEYEYEDFDEVTEAI